MKLSLAMIVKNEESVLGHCLESVQGLVDEIVIVDTGSSDATVEIAEAHGARVFPFAWVNDFALARNYALDRCTGDWLLVLDADEAIDVLDHALIRKTCEEGAAPAYRLILRNYFSGGDHATLDAPAQRNTSHYSEGKDFCYYADFRGLRLCRRMPGVGFTGRIHELVDPFFEARKLPIGQLDAVIHHYGKLFEDRESAKKTYYLELARKEARAHPSNFQCQFNLVQQALIAQDWTTVLEAADAYLRLRKDAPLLIHLAAGTAMQRLERHEEALACFQQLLAMAPNHVMGLTGKAVSLASLGRFDEAEILFRKASKLQPSFVVPLLNLSELESIRGNYAKAREILQQALEAHPDNAQLLTGLVKADVLANDTEAAVKDAWAALQKCPAGGDGLWHQLVAVWLEQRGHSSQALAVLEAGLKTFPEHGELLRLWNALISSDPGAPA
ncbi:MAG TPA: glycosyltransferase [Holophaga sp.]|jgi:glycosyltransferase involved in cell wall biosynthesis|nr:glycosyltransferase [Holophaga sp.]